MKTLMKIFIGIIIVLFVVLGYFIWRANKMVSDPNKTDMVVQSLQHEKDSLLEIIHIHEARASNINDNMDSIVNERFEIKKEYIYITKYYEKVYSILDTISYNSAKRYWADRFGTR